MKLYRIILPVNNIDKATAFYTFIFNKEGKRVSPGRHYFNLQGVILALYDPIADGDKIERPWSFHENQYLYIATEELELIHSKLKNTACTHLDETISNMPWGERLFYANDPFGNPICFVDSRTCFLGSQG